MIAYDKLEYFDNTQVLSFSYLGYGEGAPDFHVRVEIPGCFHIVPDQCFNSFLLWMLMGSMKYGRDIYVDGPVSDALLGQLEMFQMYWVRGNPSRYPRVINIKALSSDTSKPNESGPLAMCFSGGIDSTYALYKNKVRKTNVRVLDIEDCFCVRGYGIPYECHNGYERLISKIKEATDSAGVKIHCIATNVPHFNINEATGVRLTAMLWLFKKHFRGGVIACDAGIEELALGQWYNGRHYPKETVRVPCAISSFFTNEWLSTPQFPMIQEGFEHSRREKCRAIKAWDVVERTLQSCWKLNSKGRCYENCGVCGKCLSTQLAFLSCGMMPPLCIGCPTRKSMESLVPDDGHYLYVNHYLDLAKQENVAYKYRQPLEYIVTYWKSMGVTPYRREGLTLGHHNKFADLRCDQSANSSDYPTK